MSKAKICLRIKVVVIYQKGYNVIMNHSDDGKILCYENLTIFLPFPVLDPIGQV